jgi:hypothetical protein
LNFAINNFQPQILKSLKKASNDLNFDPLNMSNHEATITRKSIFSEFNALWNILDYPRALSHAQDNSLLKKIVIENPEFLSSKKRSMLHKVFRN